MAGGPVLSALKQPVSLNVPGTRHCADVWVSDSLAGRRAGGPRGGCLNHFCLDSPKQTAPLERVGVLLLFFFFLRLHLFNFLEKGEERETERDRNINIWLPL